MSFEIKGLYLGEFDVNLGPHIKYIKTNPPSYIQAVRRNFETWHNFLIPEQELCQNFVQINIDPEYSVVSWAVQYLSEIYERKKIEFNVAFIVSEQTYRKYRSSLKRNLKMLANYLLELEKKEFVISRKDSDDLVLIFEHIYDMLASGEASQGTLVILKYNMLCFLRFEKESQKTKKIEKDQIVLVSKAIDPPEKVFESNYLRYLALKEIENFRTVEQIRDGFFKQFVNELKEHPELGYAFGMEANRPTEDGAQTKSERKPRSERKVLKSMCQFIDDYILELRQKQQIYVINPFENELSYRVALDAQLIFKFINDCSNFILCIKNVDESHEENVKSFLYTLMTFMQSMFCPSKVLEIVRKTIPNAKEDWPFFFKIFLLYCNLKGKLHIVTEHYYLSRIPKERIDEVSLKLGVHHEILEKFLALLHNRTCDRDDILSNLNISDSLLNVLIAEFQVDRINF